ncbi:MAG: ATP-binding protein [Candidatus Pacebacteria bacterium]|nr:ATP-binding protein [Candidatus Paceibacterota bacterium]
MKKKLYTFVLDGGPCGGKTEALNTTIKHLESLNYKVLVVPEVPRLLMDRGIHPKDIGMKKFQEIVLPKQLELEDLAREEAARLIDEGSKVVIFHDRGLLSPIAYLGEKNDFHSYQLLLFATIGLSLKEVLARYNFVIHLKTAAHGAEEFYKNDESREESPEQARAIDDRLYFAWLRHFLDRYVVSNIVDGKQISFDKKINTFLEIVMDQLE